MKKLEGIPKNLIRRYGVSQEVAEKDWDSGVHFTYKGYRYNYDEPRWVCPEEQKARSNPIYPDTRQEYINLLALLSNEKDKEWSFVDIDTYFSLLYYVSPATTLGRLKRLILDGFIERRFNCYSIANNSYTHVHILKKGLTAIEGKVPLPYYGKHNGKEPMTYREPIPNALRHEVFKRDKHRCVACGLTNKEVALTVDHIHPVAWGGKNDLTNLQTMCFKCNIAKNNKIFKQNGQEK